MPKSEDHKKSLIYRVIANPKFWTVIGISIGSLAIIYSSKYIYKTIVKAGQRELVNLKQKITEERIKSQAIIYLDITERLTSEALFDGHKITFTFNVMEKLNLKKEHSDQKKTSPFLPSYEPGIFITDLSDNHVLLFNKFCITKNHVLVVTRRFQPQISPLNWEDFAATFKVLRALQGFAFYNSGPNSGASQQHKHIQVMPYDKDIKHDLSKFISQIVALSQDKVQILECPFFKFQHKIVSLPAFSGELYEEIGQELAKLYLMLLQQLDINTERDSYNLILTESWMLIVKRSKELAFDVLSINSLGFLGTFLLKDLTKERFLLNKNPLEILEDITYPLEIDINTNNNEDVQSEQ